MIDSFSRTPSRVHTLFRSSDRLASDVASPHNVTPEAFLVCALKSLYAHLPPELASRLQSAILLDVESAIIPNPDLLHDVSERTNEISSFFGSDRLSIVGEWFGNQDGVAAIRGRFQSEAFQLLKNDKRRGWRMLKVVLGGERVPDDSIELVRACMFDSSFASLSDDGLKEGLDAMFCASTFLKCVANDEVVAYFKRQLTDVAREMRRMTKGHDSAAFSRQLLETALNLSQCEQTTETRVSLFAGIVADMASEWPAFGRAVMPIVQQLCDQLPISQTLEVWRLNLRLRSH